MVLYVESICSAETALTWNAGGMYNLLIFPGAGDRFRRKETDTKTYESRAKSNTSGDACLLLDLQRP